MPWRSKEAAIAFVGEAPSDEELLDGFPLVGPSGRVFDQLLRTANMVRTDNIPGVFEPEVKRKGLRPMLWARSKYLITNVFDQQIPENDIKNWCQAERPEGDPPPRIDKAGWLRPEFWAHLERLRSEIALAKPTLIVPLGGTALWAFTGNNQILASRGAVGKASLLSVGTKLLPMLHPAHVTHDWKMFVPTTGDLIKANYEAGFPQVRTTDREIWVEPTLADLEYFEKKYMANPSLISTDIETAGGQITCIGFSPNEHQAIVVPFVDYRKANRSYWESPQQEVSAWAWVQKICENSAPKLLQNGMYDIYWLWRYAGIKVRNYLHDTRLMHHALFPELPKSLAFMGACYANEGSWKLMRQRRSDKRDE